MVDFRVFAVIIPSSRGSFVLRGSGTPLGYMQGKREPDRRSCFFARGIFWEHVVLVSFVRANVVRYGKGTAKQSDRRSYCFVVILFRGNMENAMPPIRKKQDGGDSPLTAMTPEELHALVERYRAILAAVPDIIVEVDTRKIYTWANEAGKKFYGEDVIGHEAAEYFIGQQDTYTKVEPLFQGSEDTIYVESRQRRCDGQERLLAWWCRVLKDEQGTVTGSLSTARDITEIRKATEQILQNEQRLRSVFHNIPVLLDAFDENQKIIVWNRECERVTGYSGEEIINRPDAWKKLYPDPEYRKKMLAEWKRRGNTFYNWQWDLTCKDGSVRTIAWSHLCEEYPIPGWASWGVGMDVTERKEAEEKIRQLNQNLEQRVQGRTEELRRAVQLMAGREIRMAELKKAIRALRDQLIKAGLDPVANDPLDEDAAFTGVSKQDRSYREGYEWRNGS